MPATTDHQVLTVADADIGAIECLLQKYKLGLVVQAKGDSITASYWGEPEAGVVGRTIYVRADTPVHSLLHESCHVICMTEQRRAILDRDAGGDHLEESGVCYLQVILADQLPDCGADRLMQDMDAWGYSFRLGSTADWFAHDAEDARQFLINQNVINEEGLPTFRLRS